MNILIVGSGGREHALAWKLAQSPDAHRLFIAPGNGGTARHGTNVEVKDSDIPGLVALAKDKAIDLVVVGPELPLTLGLTDALTEAGIPCFGPDAYGAQLEGSKAFAKNMMRDTGVPTAEYAVFDDFEAACAYVREKGAPLVVKADGLAAGKGVVVAQTVDAAIAALDDMMVKAVFGPAGSTVVVEAALKGEEASFLVFSDGTDLAILPSAQDHKAVGEGDTGPNTGGMGAYSPAPILPDIAAPDMAETTVRPILRRLAELGHPFKGVLYAGLMFTDRGPFVLEFNVRFGDPECQPLLMRLESDLAEIMLACVNGVLADTLVRYAPEAALCVVMAAKGYPGSYPKGMEITGLAQAESEDGVKVFQAGTRAQGDKTLTTGGRVLGVTALALDLAQAKAKAYRAADAIRFENSFMRRDIGDKGIKRHAFVTRHK